MLFNVYGEYIIRKALEKWKGGFPLGGKRICNLRYADDTVLVTTSMKDMKELLQRLEVESLELGLCINKSKTKLMIVDRSGNLLDTTNIPSVDIVEDYIYLGSQICNNGSCVPEIKRLIAMAKCAMIRLGSIWKNRGITFNTKSRLVRALIFPYIHVRN
ncbi:jg2878 [Pararge aegeria aegeria]|uniref:Jg2878 protein n=1 Tax=Pararge aegeria aegeria TaxID=348720 RepID=A0A8S4SNF4_9NEOP|nr:jg2878 [Pararge aegeria aegeria]